MKKILVTGFDGFQGHSNNPSWEMVNEMRSQIGGCEVIKKQLNTNFRVCADQLQAAVEEHRPDAIVSFGLAGSWAEFRAETVGWNYAGATADNAGVTPRGLLYSSPAKVGYRCSIRPELVAGWTADTPIRAVVSTDAGSYVCESLIVGWGEKIRLQPTLGGIPFAFIHVMANSEDSSFDSRYKKRSLVDMVASAEGIVAGVARDVLEVEPPSDTSGEVEYSTLKPFSPVKVDPPHSYWTTYTGAANGLLVFRYNGGVQGVPDISKLPKIGYARNAYTGPANNVVELGRKVKFSISSPDVDNYHLRTYSWGEPSTNPILIGYNDSAFYHTPVALFVYQLQSGKENMYLGKKHTIRVEGTAEDGLPFRQQFLLDLTTNPGRYTEVEWSDPE